MRTEAAISSTVTGCAKCARIHETAAAIRDAKLDGKVFLVTTGGGEMLDCNYINDGTFGAVVMTGYLGGAIATHVRVGNPLLTHTLFPIYVAAMLWGGLYLREPRLRALLPLRRA